MNGWTPEGTFSFLPLKKMSQMVLRRAGRRTKVCLAQEGVKFLDLCHENRQTATLANLAIKMGRQCN